MAWVRQYIQYKYNVSYSYSYSFDPGSSNNRTMNCLRAAAPYQLRPAVKAAYASCAQLMGGERWPLALVDYDDYARSTWRYARLCKGQL